MPAVIAVAVSDGDGGNDGRAVAGIAAVPVGAVVAAAEQRQG